MDFIHVSTMWTRLGSIYDSRLPSAHEGGPLLPLGDPRFRQFMDDLLNLTAAHVRHFQQQALANMAWAISIADFGLHEHEQLTQAVLDQWCQRVCALLTQLRAADVANISTAVGRMDRFSSMWSVQFERTFYAGILANEQLLVSLDATSLICLLFGLSRSCARGRMCLDYSAKGALIRATMALIEGLDVSSNEGCVSTSADAGGAEAMASAADGTAGAGGRRRTSLADWEAALLLSNLGKLQVYVPKSVQEVLVRHTLRACGGPVPQPAEMLAQPEPQQQQQHSDKALFEPMMPGGEAPRGVPSSSAGSAAAGPSQPGDSSGEDSVGRSASSSGGGDSGDDSRSSSYCVIKSWTFVNVLGLLAAFMRLSPKVREAHNLSPLFDYVEGQLDSACAKQLALVAYAFGELGRTPGPAFWRELFSRFPSDNPQRQVQLQQPAEEAAATAAATAAFSDALTLHYVCWQAARAGVVPPKHFLRAYLRHVPQWLRDNANAAQALQAVETLRCLRWVPRHDIRRTLHTALLRRATRARQRALSSKLRAAARWVRDGCVQQAASSAQAQAGLADAEAAAAGPAPAPQLPQLLPPPSLARPAQGAALAVTSMAGRRLSSAASVVPARTTAGASSGGDGSTSGHSPAASDSSSSVGSTGASSSRSSVGASSSGASDDRAFARQPSGTAEGPVANGAKRPHHSMSLPTGGIGHGVVRPLHVDDLGHLQAAHQPAAPAMVRAQQRQQQQWAAL